MDEPLLLSRQETARMLSQSLDTVDRLIQNHELSAVHIGRSVMIPRADVLALVTRGATTTTTNQGASQ